MKQFCSKRSGGRRAKRLFVGILALILAFSISATALADSGKGSTGAGGQPRKGGTTSQPPQSSPKPNQTGLGKGKENGNSRKSTKATGVNTDQIAEAIAALDDETVQANLTALLEAYEAALVAKQTALDAKDTVNLGSLSSAASAAKAVLDAALEAAGVSTDELYGVPEDANDGSGRMQNRPAMDTVEIAAAIAAFDGTDESKGELTSLLEAYEAALAAQNGADTSALTNDEFKALVDAVQSAERALLEATKAAGLTRGVGRGQFVNGYGNAVTDAPDVESIAARIAALEDTNENKATLTALLEAYEVALAAQNGADTSGLTQAEIDALADATKQAEQALEEALQNAGLAGEPIQEQNQQQIQVQTTLGSDANPSFELNVLQDESEQTDSGSANLFSAFLQWLNNLVQ